MDLLDSTVHSCLASGDGGGLHAGSTTTFSAEGSVWEKNVAEWMGGGIHMDGQVDLVDGCGG